LNYTTPSGISQREKHLNITITVSVCSASHNTSTHANLGTL